MPGYDVLPLPRLKALRLSGGKWAAESIADIAGMERQRIRVPAGLDRQSFQRARAGFECDTELFQLEAFFRQK